MSDDGVMRYVLDVLLLVIRLEIRQLFLDLSYHSQVIWIELHLGLYVEYCRYLSLCVLDQQDAPRL